MFRGLLRRILRRPEPKKKSPMSVCPECGGHVFYHNGHTKATHFQEHHPESRFKVEVLPSGHPRYLCLVCNKTFGNFGELVEKHRHKHKVKEGVQPCEAAIP